MSASLDMYDGFLVYVLTAMWGKHNLHRQEIKDASWPAELTILQPLLRFEGKKGERLGTVGEPTCLGLNLLAGSKGPFK